MNLDIQLAWCRHWVREQLGLKPSDSIVLLIHDSRGSIPRWSKRHRETIHALTTELRWQFSHPLCVLLSVVEPSGQTAKLQESTLLGIVDEQITVHDAWDLCGWIGAASTLFFLDSCHEPKGSGQVTFQECLRDVSDQFKKPWNLIPLESPYRASMELDWERLHQARDSQTKKTLGTVGGFNSAVDLLERCLGRTFRQVRQAG
jgi:hypothetical protein